MDATPNTTDTPSTFEEWLEEQINFAKEQMSKHYTDNSVPFEQWSTEWQNLCRVQMSYDRYKSKLLEAQPRCMCGETDSLSKVTATPLPSGTYHLCARCKREESGA